MHARRVSALSSPLATAATVVVFAAVAAAAPGMDGRALSLVGALFILPFALFSGYAGQLADSCSKRTILVATKAFEVLVMALGLLALGAGYLSAAYAVLFLMALQYWLQPLTQQHWLQDLLVGKRRPWLGMQSQPSVKAAHMLACMNKKSQIASDHRLAMVVATFSSGIELNELQQYFDCCCVLPDSQHR